MKTHTVSQRNVHTPFLVRLIAQAWAGWKGQEGQSAVELARALLEKTGGLRELERRGAEELQEAKGLGSAKIAQLKAALELGRRLLAEEKKVLGAVSSSKEVYEWLQKRSFEPLGKYRLRAMPDLSTNGWMGIERTSGKHWKELPDDYMVPLVNNPFDDCIIVGGGEDEIISVLHGRGPAYSIDAWR